MKRVLKTVGIAFIGAALGWLIGTIFDGDDVMWWVWFFMGVPAGWIFLGKYFGRLISKNLALMAFLLTMRVVLAGLIGWVIIPIELVRSLVDVFGKKGE